MWKQILKLIQAILYPAFIISSGLASLFGTIYLCFNDAHRAVLALSFFILFLIGIYIQCFWFMYRILKKKSDDGYARISIHINYYTVDAKTIIYKAQRYIQCKNFIMTHFIHRFAWSGKNMPSLHNFTSKHADIESLNYTEKGEFDEVKIKLRKPLTYNEYQLIDVEVVLDDKEQISDTHIKHKVRDNMQYIFFNVELPYYAAVTKPIPDAILYKAKIADVLLYDIDDHVKFDLNTRTYRCEVVNPLLHHTYMLKWERNP